jgi:NPCBM/NEW2 domain.
MTARSLIVVFSLSALLAFAPNVSADRSVTPKSVTITASAVPWMVVGSHLRITGTVKPHLAGVDLTLQQQKDGGWFSVADKTVDGNGDFSFITRPNRVGQKNYRVVTAKGTDFVGSSARVPVRVLHWTYLGNSQAFYYVAPIVGDLSTQPIASNGVHYEHPISLDPGCYNSWGGSAWIDYPLERQYEKFTAIVGVGDTVPTTMTLTYTLIGAGKKLASGSVVAGHSTKINVSVEGVYRLRFMINVPDPTNAAGCSPTFPQVVFGDAQLLGP